MLIPTKMEATGGLATRVMWLGVQLWWQQAYLGFGNGLVEVGGHATIKGEVDNFDSVVRLQRAAPCQQPPGGRSTRVASGVGAHGLGRVLQLHRAAGGARRAAGCGSAVGNWSGSWLPLTSLPAGIGRSCLCRCARSLPRCESMDLMLSRPACAAGAHPLQHRLSQHQSIAQGGQGQVSGIQQCLVLALQQAACKKKKKLSWAVSAWKERCIACTVTMHAQRRQKCRASAVLASILLFASFLTFESMLLRKLQAGRQAGRQALQTVKIWLQLKNKTGIGTGSSGSGVGGGGRLKQERLPTASPRAR